MKRLFLAILVMAASVTAGKAQFYVGGSLGFWHSGEKTSFGISPDAGYSFNNRWAAGLAVGFDYWMDRPVHSIFFRQDVIDFYAAPYARFNYFSKEKVKLFLDGVVGISTATYKTDNPNFDIQGRKYTDWGWQVIIRPGIAINLTDHFCLVGTFGTLGYRNDYRNTTDGFGLDLHNSLGSGFYYSF